MRERTAELETVNGQLEELSRTDALTGLANRRSFDQVKQAEFLRARRNGQPLALLLLGWRVRGERPRLAKALLATGAVTAAAALGFIVSGDERAGGALERLALWPVLFGLAGFAWTQRPRRRRG